VLVRPDGSKLCAASSTALPARRRAEVNGPQRLAQLKALPNYGRLALPSLRDKQDQRPAEHHDLCLLPHTVVGRLSTAIKMALGHAEQGEVRGAYSSALYLLR